MDSNTAPQRAFTVARKPLANADAKEISSTPSDTTPSDVTPADEKESPVLDKSAIYEQTSATYAHHTTISTPYERFSRECQRKWSKVVEKLPVSQRTFLIAMLALLVFILALSIGLGVGLHHKSSTSSSNLPLPTNTSPHEGDLTYYAPGLGACGITSSPSDAIVAISEETFDAAQKGSNPNANPLCGLMLRATRYNEAAGEERSVDLKVVDRCTGCKPSDLDTTTSVFEVLAPLESGRVSVRWAWLSAVEGIAD